MWPFGYLLTWCACVSMFVCALFCVCVCKEETTTVVWGLLAFCQWAFYICLYLGVRKKKATIKSLILIKPSCCWRCSSLAHKRPHSVQPNLDSQTFFMGLQVVWKQHYCSGRPDRSNGIFFFFLQLNYCFHKNHIAKNADWFHQISFHAHSQTLWNKSILRLTWVLVWWRNATHLVMMKLLEEHIYSTFSIFFSFSVLHSEFDCKFPP